MEDGRSERELVKRILSYARLNHSFRNIMVIVCDCDYVLASQTNIVYIYTVSACREETDPGALQAGNRPLLATIFYPSVTSLS